MRYTTNNESRSFARELLGHIQSGADQRIDTNVHKSDLGVVTSTSPLLIRPMFSGTDNSFVITNADVICDPDVEFVAKQLVVVTPLPNGYFHVLPVDQAGSNPTGTDGGGTDTTVDNSAAMGVTLDPGLRDASTSDKIVSTARKYVGKCAQGGATYNSLMSLVNGADPWCGYFTQAIYKIAQVEGAELISPAVASTYNAALDNPSKAKLIDNPGDYPGCIILKLGKPLSGGRAVFSDSGPSDHTTLFISGNKRTATTIGGNENDNVALKEGVTLNPGGKYRGGVHFLVLKGLMEARTPVAPDAGTQDTP
jgi:hypothetical protein